MMRTILVTIILSAAVAAVASPVTDADREAARRWSPDALWEMTRSLSVHPQWIDDGDVFWYRFLTSAGRHYRLVDPERGRCEDLFENEVMAAELSRLTGDAVEVTDLDLNDFEFEDGYRRFSFARGRARYAFDRDAARLSFLDSLPPPAPAPEPWRNDSPDGRFCVFARGHDLFMLEGGVERRLSDDGARALSWGNDWSLIDDGDREPRAVPAAWSPDSRRFALLRADLREVDDLWLVDHLADPRPTLKTFKVPPVGGAVPIWELWIGDCETASMIRVRTERWPDQTLDDLFGGTVMWAPDGSALFFMRRHRDYTKLDACAADPATGAVAVLIEERGDDMIYTREPAILPDGVSALWWSMRDGWGHLYRYGLDGSLSGRVTSGEWMVDEVVAVQGDRVFFTGMGREPGRNPYLRHLYRVGLDGAEPRLLTPEDAEHSVSLSPSRRYFVDSFSRVDMPTRSVLRDADGRLVLDLETADTRLLTEAGWRPPEVFHVPGADGETEQWGVMWKPFDFDPAKTYPIVTRVYPGKQGEYIQRTFWPATLETSLAQLGCVVVRFGNRGGTWERGQAYRSHGRDDFRDYGLADKKAVLERLAERHAWIDGERVGIFGGSSGGFMTVSAMLVHPEFFKVGVAMTSPNEPRLYYNHWVERYAGLDDEARGNIELADRLAGPLLMIYGAQDENVHPLHLYRQARAFIEAGKGFDMFVVPGAGHGLGDRRYLYGMVAEYFAEHLIEECAGSADSFYADGR